MTREALAITPSYPINGVGPYQYNNPYTLGTLRAFVELDDKLIALATDEYVADPLSSNASGNIALTTAAASDYDGGTLYILRQTDIEQGFSGQSARENGLAAQLDWMTEAIQDTAREVRRSLRSTSVIEPGVIKAGRTIMFDENLNMVPGPTSVELENVVLNAEASVNAAAVAVGAAAASKENANKSTSQAVISTTQAGVAVTAASEATLAAIAAGANLVTSLTDPIPANGSIELLQTGAGTQVHEVQAGAWVQIGWLGVTVFPTIAALSTASGFVNQQYIDVNDALNGGIEQFKYKAFSTLPPDGIFIIDAEGMGDNPATRGRFISQRKVYANWSEFDADNRDLNSGVYLAVQEVGFFKTVEAGGLELTGGLRVRPIAEKGVVSTAQFGVPDSTTVSAVARLKFAIEYVAANGLRLVGVSGQTHLIDGDMTCDCAGSKPSEIDMNGATILYENDGTNLTIEGAVQKAGTITGISASRGDPLVAVSDATTIEPGNLLVITNPAPWSGSTKTVHAYTVDELDGNNVYIDGIVQGDIKNQQVIDAGVAGSITGVVYTLSPSLKIKNWRAKIEGQDTLIDQCGVVRGFSDLSFEDCSLNGHTRNCFYALRCSRVRFKGGWLADMGYLDKNEAYSESAASAPGGTGTSFGYGLITAECSFVYVDATMAGQGWHAVDFASGTMVAVVDGGIYARNALALSMHESSWNITLQNVVLVGGEAGGGGRAAYVTYRNSTFNLDTLKNGVNGLTGAWEVIFDDVDFNSQLPEVATVSSFIASTSVGAEPGHGMRSVGYNRRFITTRCRFNGKKRVLLGFNNATFTIPTELVVEDNRFYKPEGVTIIAGDITSIEDNKAIMASTGARFEVQKLRAGMSLYVRDNRIDNLLTFGGAAIRFSGDGGVARFYLDDNKSSGYGALFDFAMTNATTIDSIISNTARGASFLCFATPADTHTADAVVKNVWDGTAIAFSDDLIVTTAAQNVAV